MKKLLIVDGSALLFQSFFGMPRKITNQKGQYIEAVICFIGILFKTLKMIEPDLLLIVFDGENELQRQQIDNNYKANRTIFSDLEDCDNPFPQLQIIQNVLNELKFQWLETTNCEADDLIASIVNDYKEELEIVISSSDKDFYQLIEKNVNVFTYRGKVSKLWTASEIYNKYGFEAKHFSTLKALSGDLSDNIKGIKGIGIKTASNLIRTQGDLYNIYKNINKINPRIASLLRENRSLVEKNFQLIELHSKKNLFSLPNCEYNLITISSTSILKQLGIM